MARFPLRLSRLAAVLMLGAATLGAPHASAQAVKQSITGLVTMGALKFIRDPSRTPDNSFREANTHPGVYAGVAILATWKQLEPQQGKYDFSAIDTGLANIRAYNARYPSTPLKGKLRVFAGPNAPDWALHLGGEPIALDDHDHSVQIGHVWSMPYRAAWKGLQNALAARYDTNPLVEEVAITSCSTSSAEPFHTPLAPANVQPMIDAGYTNEAMKACISGAVDDYDAWKHVALDLTFNPMRIVSGDKAVSDTAFPESVMRDFRSRLGSRAVLANHGLQPEVRPAAESLLAQMKALGPPIEFQTRGTNLDMDASVQTGEALGMTEFEVWDSKESGGAANITQDQLRQWSSQLRGR